METRYRRRELDLIASEDARRLFIDRAKIISAVRGYLDGQGFVEVETPVLQPLYGGALARPFTTHHNALERTLYLRIATELYLKRLLVGGLERVYELGKDFRNEGVSTKHNPEFTMVEFYEAYTDYEGVAVRLEELVRAAAAAIGYSGEIDFAGTWRRVSFVAGDRRGDGHRPGERARCRRAARGDRRARAADPHARTRRGRRWPTTCCRSSSSRGSCSRRSCATTRSSCRRSRASTAALPGLVERWEAFAGGMEIANAFSELNDADAQRERFEAQRAAAEGGDEEAQPYDELFVQALEQGMPPAGGVGPGHRPAGDAADRPRLDPRGRAVPGDARLSGERRPARPAARSDLKLAARSDD